MEVGRGLGGGSPLTTVCWFAPPTLSHAGEACPILCDMVRWVRFALLAFYRSAAGAGPGRRGLGDAPTLPPSRPTILTISTKMWKEGVVWTCTLHRQRVHAFLVLVAGFL